MNYEPSTMNCQVTNLLAEKQVFAYKVYSRLKQLYYQSLTQYYSKLATYFLCIKKKHVHLCIIIAEQTFDSYTTNLSRADLSRPFCFQYLTIIDIG